MKPALRRSGSPVRKPEPKCRLPEQRHWLKFFLVGLFLITYGSLQFMAGRPDVSNIFNDPVFAAYWVTAGIAAILAGLILRTWGSR